MKSTEKQTLSFQETTELEPLTIQSASSSSNHCLSKVMVGMFMYEYEVLCTCIIIIIWILIYVMQRIKVIDFLK